MEAAASRAIAAAAQQYARKATVTAPAVAASFVHVARSTQGGCVAAISSRAAINQAGSQAAEAAEARRLLRQGRTSGGLGGLGGRCDRSRRARATVGSACVRPGGGRRRLVLRQLS